MPCYTDECNQAPFELSDPTLVYPERSPRGASPLALPPRPNLGNFSYLLCFDNDPFCLSRNPFLLITIWIAYVRELRPTPSLRSFTLLPLSFALLQKSKIYLPSFQSFAHSLPKTTGVYPRAQSATRSVSSIRFAASNPVRVNSFDSTEPMSLLS